MILLKTQGSSLKVVGIQTDTLSGKENCDSFLGHLLCPAGVCGDFWRSLHGCYMALKVKVLLSGSATLGVGIPQLSH